MLVKIALEKNVKKVLSYTDTSSYNLETAEVYSTLSLSVYRSTQRIQYNGERELAFSGF